MVGANRLDHDNHRSRRCGPLRQTGIEYGRQGSQATRDCGRLPERSSWWWWSRPNDLWSPGSDDGDDCRRHAESRIKRPGQPFLVWLNNARIGRVSGEMGMTSAASICSSQISLETGYPSALLLSASCRYVLAWLGDSCSGCNLPSRFW
jgi:hypothetical protein